MMFGLYTINWFEPCTTVVYSTLYMYYSSPIYTDLFIIFERIDVPPAVYDDVNDATDISIRLWYILRV